METNTDLSNLIAKVADKKTLPEIAWEPGLDGDALTDSLHDTLADEDISGRWEDAGIGPYEYWGARGHDSHMVVESDPAQTIIRVKGLDHVVPLPEEKIRVDYSGGGCDGEHRGRCRAACAEWEATVEWKAIYQEVRAGDLYIVVVGEPA